MTAPPPGCPAGGGLPLPCPGGGDSSLPWSGGWPGTPGQWGAPSLSPPSCGRQGQGQGQ